MKTIKYLKETMAEALKLNALCMGHPDGNPMLPRNENNDLLRKDISDARWKVKDLIDELEKQGEEI